MDTNSKVKTVDIISKIKEGISKENIMDVCDLVNENINNISTV